MPFLACLGHTNIDVQIHVEDLPTAGNSSPVQERRTVYGGTAANIARHAAGLGVPVRLWSRVGRDFPPDWKVALEADGVDLSFLDIDVEALTPTCYILTDAVDQQSYCMDQAAMATMLEHPPTPALLDGLSWLHVGTGDPKAYDVIVDAARASGVKVAFDAGQELRFMYDTRAFEQLLDRSDVVFLNETEMDLALRFLGYGDPVQLLDHVDTIVATHGADGATLYRAGRKALKQDAFKVDSIDPTGAGDALRAGWYAALHAGKDMVEALRWGQAAAAVAVQHLGPQSHVVRQDDLATVL